jgi:hypothetical protein
VQAAFEAPPTYGDDQAVFSSIFFNNYGKREVAEGAHCVGWNCVPRGGSNPGPAACTVLPLLLTRGGAHAGTRGRTLQIGLQLHLRQRAHVHLLRVVGAQPRDASRDPRPRAGDAARAGCDERVVAILRTFFLFSSVCKKTLRVCGGAGQGASRSFVRALP